MSLGTVLVLLEGWWIYHIHRTHTGATREELSGKGNNPENGFWYMPTRPSVARKILNSLPVSDFKDFTFVDVGCGKGRVIYLAASHNFKAIVGIDRDPALCAIARANVDLLGDSRLIVEELDARLYKFPNTPLVLYLFNPFGEQILERFLTNLEASLVTHPRRVIIALMFPEYAHVLERFSRFKAVKQVSNCRIYVG